MQTSTRRCTHPRVQLPCVFNMVSARVYRPYPEICIHLSMCLPVRHPLSTPKAGTALKKIQKHVPKAHTISFTLRWLACSTLGDRTCSELRGLLPSTGPKPSIDHTHMDGEPSARICGWGTLQPFDHAASRSSASTPLNTHGCGKLVLHHWRPS